MTYTNSNFWVVGLTSLSPGLRGILVIFLLLPVSLLAQYDLSGTVIDASKQKPIADAEVFNKSTNYLLRTDNKGKFTFKNLKDGTYNIVVFVTGYNAYSNTVEISSDQKITIELQPYSTELNEVVINQKREEVFNLNRLNPVEGTSIYAGKKSEVVLIDKTVGNLAANNARQIYSQVVGLNIYENNDAGLQLNIGGRGLDPNRTANFNTRQNGYDISADVLGYPESYYTPPAEAINEIQVVRGAASLQYGSQFGGLINFKLKKPNPVKKLEWVSRQTYGSFNLFTSFNSLSGTIGKFSYYTYFNYKQGDGFRPNSGFDSKNFYSYINYSPKSGTDISIEATYLNYLAEQPGGLTDTQFEQDIDFSNRDRNWFEVDWKLLAFKLKHKFSFNTDFSLTLFGLDAERNALGFRGDPLRPQRNPITEPDDPSEFTRDLIKGEFNNWGAEARLLHRYKVLNRDAVFLIGTKYYDADNTSVQGPGTNDDNANFNFQFSQFPDYPNQSSFEFPNLNTAVFGENIFFISKNFSLTPGFRFEYIKTEAEGQYISVTTDNAGNVISRSENEDDRFFDRTIFLLGLGASYNYTENLELYANVSQNYRSVTFSDIRVVNPTFIVDPGIIDEKGFTADLGMRGKWSRYISYDLSAFAIKYNERLGTILVESGPDKGDRVRKNIGDAIMYGMEIFADWNLASSIQLDKSKFKLNPFINLAVTGSEYIESQENNVTGKQVEFIPLVNLKTGMNFGYKNLLGSLQYTYLSEQYTDAENSAIPQPGDSREGVIGEIPSYGILDFSLSYSFGKFKLESGINNLLDERYFTRRATAYPGPGIIPSDPRSFYTTLQVKL